MDQTVWYSCVGLEDIPDRMSALRSIARFENHRGRFAASPARGPGILFVAELGPEIFRRILELTSGGRDRLLVVASDHNTIGNDAWRLLEAGASDLVIWENPQSSLPAVEAKIARWIEIDRLLAAPAIRGHLIGNSSVWMRMLREVIEAARYTDAPILLLGETGTGKEQIARLIHSLDDRRSQHEMVTVDCTTVVPELAGSELFGHERGSFTSAIAARDGAFAIADGGTLFLDEVGELPVALQPQLLRAVQEQMYKRVGSNTWRATDFRLVCATNRDLLQDENVGLFRRDLFYRIAGWVIALPPLRERPDDIIPLAEHFFAELRPGAGVPTFCPEVREYLVTRDYPGNVRDLRRLVGRIACRHVGPGPVTIGDIPEEERLPVRARELNWPDKSFDSPVRNALELGAGLRDIRRLAEDAAIRIVTLDEAGNLQRAAKRLGVTDRALQQRRSDARRMSEEIPRLQTG